MNQLQKSILEYTRENGGITHADIEYIFDEYGFEYIGNLFDCLEENENIVFWYGWNEEAFNVLQNLLTEGFLIREPATPLVVFLMGKAPSLPRAERKYNYKTERWLPVMFRLAKTEKNTYLPKNRTTTKPQIGVQEGGEYFV